MQQSNSDNVSQGPWQRATSLEQFEAFSVGEWAGRQPSARQWVVDGMIPVGQVVMISGDGGKGKSLLIQQLLTACALGDKWVGARCKRMRALGVFCEDSKNELHIRQQDINEYYECDMPDVSEELYYQSRINQLSYMVGFDRYTDEMKTYQLFDQLRFTIAELGIQVLALDTVRKVYGGSEVNEKQVAQFLTLMRKLAVEMQGCVILSAHPSADGLNTGSGRFGSGAWHNDVRGRMYLTDPKTRAGQEPDPSRRVLRTMKNNYGKNGGIIELKWKRGVFVTDDDTPLQDWRDEPALGV